MKTLVYQCRLRNRYGNKHSGETVTWLTKYEAKVGTKIVIEGGGPSHYVVAIVYEPPLKQKALKEKQRMDRNALPSIGVTRVS